jgi:hypothetical protein
MAETNEEIAGGANRQAEQLTLILCSKVRTVAFSKTPHAGGTDLRLDEARLERMPLAFSLQRACGRVRLLYRFHLLRTGRAKSLACKVTGVSTHSRMKSLAREVAIVQSHS